MESAKHKLSTRGCILFQIYHAKYLRVQFLPDIVIYWYTIITVCKLDHNFLKVNQYSNLFINPNCKSDHTSTESILIKQDLFAYI